MKKTLLVCLAVLFMVNLMVGISSAGYVEDILADIKDELTGGGTGNTSLPRNGHGDISSTIGKIIPPYLGTGLGKPVTSTQKPQLTNTTYRSRITLAK